MIVFIPIMSAQSLKMCSFYFLQKLFICNETMNFFTPDSWISNLKYELLWSVIFCILLHVPSTKVCFAYKKHCVEQTTTQILKYYKSLL